MAPHKHAKLTSPKVKALAAKALRSPSLLSTEETRELGGSVLAHIENTSVATAAPVKGSAKKAATKVAAKVAVKTAVKAAAKNPVTE